MVAGKGKRLGYKVPKCLVNITNNKKLIDFSIQQMISLGVTRIFIVVNYKRELIKKYIYEKYYDKNIKFLFLTQKRINGIAKALYLLNKLIDKPFWLFLGDSAFNLTNKDFYKFLNLYIKYKSTAIQAVTKEESLDTIKNTNNIVIKNKLIKSITEKPEIKKSNYVGAGIYFFDKNIFNYLKITPKNIKTGNYELTDTINSLALKNKAYAIKLSRPIYNINTKEDLRKAKLNLKDV